MERKKLLEAIKIRKSVRGYQNKEIPGDILNKIKDFIPSIPGIAGQKINVHLYESKILKNSITLPIGSFLAEAPYFFAVTSQQTDFYLQEAGFQSEYLVLYLTSLGLGTCYISLFVNLNDLEKKLNIPKDEKLLIISPIGYAKDDLFSMFTDSILKFGMMMSTGIKRKVLNQIVFFEEWDKNINGFFKNNSDLEEIFNLTRLAPSGANIQPWRFVVKDKIIYVFSYDIQYDNPFLTENMWGMDYSRFDVGIAMSHFHIAANVYGYSGKWFFPEKRDYQMVQKMKVPDHCNLIGIWKN